jgi:hypothetical protein
MRLSLQRIVGPDLTPERVMRNYWLKIAAKALGIFAVGMIFITTVRGVKTKVVRTLEGTDPVPLPLMGMVPFRLDSAQLGSLSRLEFLRSDPQHVSGIRVVVRLADSISPTKLRACAIALDDVENIDERTTFRCQDPQGAVGDLAPFGTVVLRGEGDSFPLLLPSRAIAELRSTRFNIGRHGVEISSPADARREALEARTEAMRETLDTRIDARSDSVDTLRDLADAYEDSASEARVAERRVYQRRADSVRSVMRAVIDRMKLDEARLDAFKQMHALDPAEIDSLVRASTMIRDSVHRQMAEELQRMQRELNQLPTATQVGQPASAVTPGAGASAAVEAPAAPAKPRPAPAARP